MVVERARRFALPMASWRASACLVAVLGANAGMAQTTNPAALPPSTGLPPTGAGGAVPGTPAEPTSDQQAAGASSASQGTATSSGNAQSIADIIVTAERRSLSLQRTAAAVSVRDGLALQREGKFTLREQLEDVPSLTTDDSGTLATAGSDTAGGGITIRGIGANAQPGAVSAVPAVAVYVDGVIEGVGSSYDIDRIEVLRGPQGTLYGRSATAGVVSFHTRDPRLGEWGGDAAAEIGNYDLRHYTGALNVPVNDKVAIRISADQYARDGFYNGNAGAVNRTSGRIKLLLQPTDTTTMIFGVAVDDNKINSGGAQGVYSPGTGVQYTNILPATTSKNHFWQYWADIKLDVGAVTIDYLPALRTWRQDAVQSSVGPALLPLRLLVNTPQDRFLTQELRLSGLIGERLHWLGGVFYYDNKLHNTNDIRWASSNGLLAMSDTRRHTRNVGLYGDATYDLSPTWRLTGGLRWDYTRVQTDQTYTTNLLFFCNTPLAPTLPDGTPLIPGCLAGSGANAGLPEVPFSASVGGDAGERTFHNFNFRARVEHDLAPNHLVYATVSSGFIPGDVQFGTGMNAAGQQVPEVRPYSPETLTAYEVGAKNRFLGNALELNGDVFYYDYGGFQMQVNPDPANPSAQFLVTVPARVWGAELESVVRLGRDDRVAFNYSYTGSRLRDLPPAFTSAVSQHFVTGVPPHTFNLDYGHTFHLGTATLVVGGYARYIAPFDRAGISPAFVAQLAALGFDRDMIVRQKGQFTADLTSTLTFGDGHFSLTGYVRNLLDNRYNSGITLQSVVPVLNASGNRYDPRTFGVVGSVRF